MKPPRLSGIETGSVVLAIDFGGTKIASGIVDQAGVVSHHHVVSTESVSAEDLYQKVEGVARQTLIEHRRAKNDEGVVALGVGCGGPMDTQAGRVSPANVKQWRDFPLRDRLCESFDMATFLDNDAKALALGEGWVGAASHSENFMAMVVSTGVGGGIVIDGRLLDGRLGNAGHVGHIIAVPGGRLCSCGARGCLEAETSGTAIAAMTGQPAALAGAELRVRTGRLVGRGVSSVINLLDLDLVVVAGSVALGFGEPFFSAAQASIVEYCHMAYSRSATIVPAKFAADSPLVGAGAVGWYGMANAEHSPVATPTMTKGSFP